MVGISATSISRPKAYGRAVLRYLGFPTEQPLRSYDGKLGCFPFDASLKVIKSVPTGEKPCGLAFDRSGKQIFVSVAAAHKLQIFNAESLQLLAEVPTAQRCWHFTFTPDDSRILLACGRSNNIVVVDPNSYKPVTTLDRFRLPWGIVTYPTSYGSLGLP